jgi:hypothetical protein
MECAAQWFFIGSVTADWTISQLRMLKMVTTYWIKALPSQAAYGALLDLCAESCTSFSLVLNSSVSPQPSESATSFVAKLEPFVLSDELKTSWPGGGTVAPGKFGRVIRAKMCDDTLSLLKAAASDLYEWLQPSLPEDPAFYRDDGTVYLATISHEGCAFFELQPAELTQLISKLPFLELLKDPPF